MRRSSRKLVSYTLKNNRIVNVYESQTRRRSYRNGKKLKKYKRTYKTKNKAKRALERSRKQGKKFKMMEDDTDPFDLKGKKICNIKSKKLYFGDLFAGSNFYVYSVCVGENDQKCDKYLAKVYDKPRKGWKNKSDITRERNFMVKAAAVSPKVIGYVYCLYNDKLFAIIIMEKYGEGPLTDLLKNGEYEKNKEQIDRQLRDLLDYLYAINIDHNDLHSDNILYKKIGSKYEFKIIDFDLSRNLDERKRTYEIEIRGTRESISL